MTLNDKCLLVLKPAEALHHWLASILQASQKMLQTETAQRQAAVEISLEDMQTDATCYIIPTLPPEETAAYLEQHTEAMFRAELNTWCQSQEVWPKLSFSNFVSSFKFDFYFDWMNFEEQEVSDANSSVKSIVLLVKPNEPFKEYLRTLLMDRFNLTDQEIEAKLDFSLIQNGSTAVITDVETLEELDYFIDQHAEEIFIHQLILWGGEDSEEFWPRDLDARAFKEWFSIEIHRHTYLMLH